MLMSSTFLVYNLVFVISIFFLLNDNDIIISSLVYDMNVFLYIPFIVYNIVPTSQTFLSWDLWVMCLQHSLPVEIMYKYHLLVVSISEIMYFKLVLL